DRAAGRRRGARLGDHARVGQEPRTEEGRAGEGGRQVHRRHDPDRPVNAARAALPPLTVWGSELSPYTLKLQALLAYAELPYRMWPVAGGRAQTLSALLRIALAKRRRPAARSPALSALDESPLVPFLLPDRSVSYDPSALARWLDDLPPPATGPLVP